MTLGDAYNYIDLLLDKANQPFFTNGEKNMILNLSIKEFMDSKYALMRINQDFSEQYGNRVDLNQGTSGFTVVGNYVELTDYYHITFAALNGVTCRIVSDDELSELRVTNNPFKQINSDNPACAIVQGPTEIRLFFHHGPTSPDFTIADTFSVRYLKYLDTTDFNNIPEPYQQDIINIAVRKMTGTIESSNYSVQVNEQSL